VTLFVTELSKNSAASLPPGIVQSRRVILVCYYILIGYFLISSVLYYGSIQLAAIVVWLIQVLPLSLFAAGLHRNHLRTYAWLSFVILLYFTHGVVVAFDPARLWLGLIQVTASATLFVFLIIYIRSYRDHFKVNL
jgi:uncharacterized membrane protein